MLGWSGRSKTRWPLRSRSEVVKFRRLFCPFALTAKMNLIRAARLKSLVDWFQFFGRNSEMAWWRAALVFVLVALLGGSLAADTVTTVTAAGATMTRSGTVVDYTASELRLRPAGGREVTVPAVQVVRIETARTAAHEAAEKSFVERDWKAAAEQFGTAIRGEERGWVRREMLAQMTRCYRALGDGDAAGRVFLQLVKSEATDAQFAAIPLVWQATDKLTLSERHAREWVEAAGSSSANLIGASYLLASADAAVATTVLDRLTRDRDPRIALLAETQRWRVRQAGVAAEELSRRRATIERLARPLRGGPTLVFAQSLAGASKVDLAVAELLRVPIEHANERTLAAASLTEAANLLRSAKRDEEAAAIERERDREYGATARAN